MGKGGAEGKSLAVQLSQFHFAAEFLYRIRGSMDGKVFIDNGTGDLEKMLQALSSLCE